MTNREGFILVFAHGRQIYWYASVIAALKKNHDVGARIWVQGRDDKERAESTGVYSAVVDLTAIPDTDDYRTDESSVKADYPRNLNTLRRYEDNSSTFRYRRAVDIDRFIRRRSWSDEKVAAYTVSLIQRMKNDLETAPGQPILAFGENNTLYYRLAHSLLSNIPYLHFLSARHWEDRFFWSHRQNWKWTAARRKYRRFLREGVPKDIRQVAINKLDSFRSAGAKLRYVKAAEQKVAKKDVVRGFADLIGACRKMLEELVRGESERNPRARTPWQESPMYYMFEQSAKLLRQGTYERYFCEEVPSGTIATYFLHYQPEAVLDSLLIGWRDQLEIIRAIAVALPADVRLVVKEHGPMLGRRKVWFYNRLRENPNITMVSARSRAFDLIKRSEAVFSPVGTVALEGLYLGTPSFVFGDIFFAEFEGITYIEDIGRLRSVVRERMGQEKSNASDEMAIRALAAMYAASTPGRIGPWYSESEIRQPDNIERLVAPLNRVVEKMLEGESLKDLAANGEIQGISIQA